MDDDIGFFRNEKLLLALGVGFTVVFVGILVYDLLRRRRRARRHRRREPTTLRETLLTPVQRAQALWNDLKNLLHERSRRERRRRRRPPEPPA
jgi:hypothetical protein